jgi:uncharacterized protein YdaU (DUF1376 family)
MTDKKTEGEKRLASARGELKRMKEEIAPFVKERDRQTHSTAGQWRDTRTTAAQRSNSVVSGAGQAAN